MKIRINSKSIIKYISILFICLVLSNASVGGLSPFLYAFFFACIFVGLDEKLMAVFCLGSSLIIGISLENILISLTVVAIGLISYYIHKVLKKAIHFVEIFFLFVLSLATYIYYNYIDYTNLIFYILLGLISLFVFIVVLQVMLLRKNCFKLTLDESICFLFFLCLIGVGIAPITIYYFSLYRLLIPLMVLICIAIGSAPLTYSITLSLSLGVAIYDMNLLVVSEMLILSLVSGIFSMPKKYKISITMVLVEIFIQYVFLSQGIDIVYQAVPILFACIIFVLIPNKTLNRVSDFVYVKKSEMTSRSLINTTRKSIKKRMSELSNVFLEMKQIHLNMVKKELTKSELTNMLMRELLSTSCRDCLDKNRCTRSLGTDNKSNIEALIEIAITKGKVTLLDLPAGMTNRCGKVNQLVSIINRICDEYRQYKLMMADINNVKILLADQMGAVSKLLLKLGDEIDSNVRFDTARENKIISKLLSRNIHCKEVLLYTEKNEDLSAVIIVKADNAYNPILEKILSEALRVPMQITKVTPVDDMDYNSVVLKKRGKYDCVFGLATTNKSGNTECGDCHSIIRLSRDKFLLALCDGMGTGSSANKMSAMTLGLIENFYKVGFDNDIILESVNKLLAINNQENYSTLDICLMDLDREIADFIKVGAPFGLIKRDNNIEVVEGGSLPIGALDSISPATYKTTLTTKDMVIMTTDGITDAFETSDRLIDYVRGLATNNPQMIAEAILNEALELSERSAKDDMTVLVARTYLKNRE